MRHAALAPGGGGAIPAPPGSLAVPSQMDGFILLVASLFLFVALSFWMAASKLLPPTGNSLIDWMRTDDYYCFLVPLSLVPVSLFANYLRWATYSLLSTN